MITPLFIRVEHYRPASSGLEGQNLGAGAQTVQIIGPVLRQLSWRLEVQRRVIGHAHCVALLVCKLQLDVRMIEAVFMSMR
jgi:hypothetical protein